MFRFGVFLLNDFCLNWWVWSPVVGFANFNYWTHCSFFCISVIQSTLSFLYTSQGILKFYFLCIFKIFRVNSSMFSCLGIEFIMVCNFFFVFLVVAVGCREKLRNYGKENYPNLWLFSLFLNSCSLQVNLHMWTLDCSHNTCDFVIYTSIFCVNLVVLLLAELCGRVVMDCTEAFIHALINNTNFLFYIDDCALIGCI